MAQFRLTELASCSKSSLERVGPVNGDGNTADTCISAVSFDFQDEIVIWMCRETFILRTAKTCSKFTIYSLEAHQTVVGLGIQQRAQTMSLIILPALSSSKVSHWCYANKKSHPEFIGRNCFRFLEKKKSVCGIRSHSFRRGAKLQ